MGVPVTSTRRSRADADSSDANEQTSTSRTSLELLSDGLAALQTDAQEMSSLLLIIDSAGREAFDSSAQQGSGGEGGGEPPR
jgi:hypothetical protein